MKRTPFLATLTMMGLLGGGPSMAQDGAATAVPMTQAQVATVLRARGYSDIEELTRDGDVFRIPAAKRYGEPVHDLEVDAVSGQVRNERLTEGQARAMLRGRGFSEISAIQEDGEVIHAQAKRAGNPVSIRIDARTGAVEVESSRN